MNIRLVGPVVRTGLCFAYSIFDGKVVTASFPYLRIDQARYARDRESGEHIETMDEFDGAVATIP
jgi:hypothetical protein